MSQLRKEIRKQIAKVLNGKTRAGSNIGQNAYLPNWQEILPVINIYSRGEDLEEEAQAPRLLKRILKVEIEIIDGNTDSIKLSDALDDLAETVESLLAQDDSLSGLCSDMILRNVSDNEGVPDGGTGLASLRLFYDVTYFEYFPRSAKGQGLVPLKKINSQWQVGHHDDEPDMAEADRARDEIVF